MHFVEEDDFEAASRIREILGWTVKQEDPYGFFYFQKVGKKVIPAELSGAFTTVAKIEEAIKNYEHKLNKDKEKTIAS